MRIFKSISPFVLLFSMSLFFAACGGETKNQDQESEATYEHDATHDHDHDHATHGKTAAYTAAYVCPMHCEGSGSEEPGKCPVCNMDYVAQADHVKDGHTHE